MSTGQSDSGQEYTSKLDALRVAVDHLDSDGYSELLDSVEAEMNEYGHLQEDTREQFKEVLFQLYDVSQSAKESLSEDVDTYEEKQERREQLEQLDDEEDSEYLVKKGENPKIDEHATLEAEKKQAETEKSSYRKDIDAILGALKLVSEDSDITYGELQDEAQQYHRSAQNTE